MPSLYGITVSLAILSCLYAGQKIFPEKKKEIWDLGLYALISGIIGARIYHVIDYWQYYQQFPLKILQLWNGGLGIWGAVIGGAVGVFIYSRVHGRQLLEMLDVSATLLPLGQAIGRWGNYFNSEIEGPETKLFWAIKGRHPIFLYESLLNLVLFIILIFIARKKDARGTLTAVYLGGYGIIRFFLEYLRDGSWKVNGLNVAQMISILSIVTSVYIFRRIKK